MSTATKTSGIQIDRYFTLNTSPFDAIQWEKRTAAIVNSKGETIFEQKNVEVPVSWTQQATNIVASKYFYGKKNSSEREYSVRQLVSRIVDTIAEYGRLHGYFAAGGTYQVFRDELAYILLNQLAAFNSPVQFNCGCHLYEPNAQAKNYHWNPSTGKIEYTASGYNNPQCSACFINGVEDSMDGIMSLARTEAMLFKFGSGTGTNFSSLRSSKEGVSGGGVASGPLSFMKGLDAFAGVIKSGGKTRRAAKMAILNADHPDIEDFILCKWKEELKAQALMKSGYDGSSGPDSEAYSSIFYQNANNSVRVSDAFMDAVKDDGLWELISVSKPGESLEVVKARDLMRQIAEATWQCGDPGMQFDTRINTMHTCKATDRIYASNPCSEYMFLDNSACNLASLNLMKFYSEDQGFDISAFRRAVHTLTIAMDIIVDLSGYPTESIASNSHDYRPLGLGYANLGTLLMMRGLPYDSEDGRDYAAAITAIMTGQAYLTSSLMARNLDILRQSSGEVVTLTGLGCFPCYAKNAESFHGVMESHSIYAKQLRDKVKEPRTSVLTDVAVHTWDEVVRASRLFGFRNAQATVLAPTGTIGFMMDCDTTGIEPELALTKYKKLVGGGQMKIVNESVPAALARLGYKDKVKDLLLYIEANGTLEGSELDEAHLPIFDTSFKSGKSTRSIHYMGHIKMMAATQPFLSGAISKTVNMPHDATVEDIENAYIESWKLGLKAVAIYRDGSKANQVLVTKKDQDLPIGGLVDNNTIEVMLAHREQVPPSKELLDLLTEQFGPYLMPTIETDNPAAPPKAVRHKLPNTRPALTHKFTVGGHDGYLTVGLYPNGQPGEIFITMAKEGSTISGFMDCFALVFSIALQHGTPLDTLVGKLENTRFEPSGWTGDERFGYAKSIMDYIAKWLRSEYLIQRTSAAFPVEIPQLDTPVKTEAVKSMSDSLEMSDSPACPDCGCITVRSGSCYKCLECGSTTGCS